MKKSLEILSCVLLIATMLTVMVWPAFAAFPDDAKAYIWVEKEQQSDPDIYKITMHISANYPVSSFRYLVYWPKAEFKMIRNTGVKNSSVSGSNAVNKLGCLTDTKRYDDTEFEKGYVDGAGKCTCTANARPNSGSFNEAVPYGTYTGMSLLVYPNYSNHYFFDSSRWGTEVAEFYVQKLSDAPEDAIDHVDVYEAASEFYYVNWQGLDADNTAPAAESLMAAGSENAFTLVFGKPSSEESGSIIAHKTSQIKMTPTSASTVEDDFQFRVVSRISDEDWNAYLANTGNSKATTNCLTQLGFVAYKGADGFDMEAAKAAAKAGTTQGDYFVATTDYVKHESGSDAEFAARIDTSKDTCSDVTYIAFAKYLDGDGAEQYAFYDTESQALLKTNYDSLVSRYLASRSFAG